MSKLVLIDGNAILHRAYHALPPLTTKSGEPINAVYGFVSMLLRVIQDLKPTHIAVAFDRPEPTFRHVAFKQYQAQRPAMEKELSSQFDKAKVAIESFGIPIFEKAGYEADDIIGTIALQSTKIPNFKYPAFAKPSAGKQIPKIDEVVVVTGDRDILQLVNDKVKVYLPVKGLSEAKLFGKNEVKEKMGVGPKYIVDYKALVGDPSDNYPGVAGIGPKTAIKLIEKYRSLDEIYKQINELGESTRNKLKENKDNAYLSYKLAKIITDVPVEIEFDSMEKWSIGNQKTVDLFKHFGFKTLTERVKKVGKLQAEEKQMKLI